MIPDNTSILDVGHGYGYTGLRLKIHKKNIHLTGIDSFRPYHETQRKLSIYDELKLCDARRMPYPTDSFDICLASHIIEHLSREDGVPLLRELERVARKRVIVCTPDGFHREDGKTRDSNPASIHKSGYRKQFFTRHGYNMIYVPRSRSRVITAIREVGMLIHGDRGRHRNIIAWKNLRKYYDQDAVICKTHKCSEDEICQYYDNDGVICNEEPHNCSCIN